MPKVLIAEGMSLGTTHTTRNLGVNIFETTPKYLCHFSDFKNLPNT